jgi:hypothetical protein
MLQSTFIYFPTIDVTSAVPVLHGATSGPYTLSCTTTSSTAPPAYLLIPTAVPSLVPKPAKPAYVATVRTARSHMIKLSVWGRAPDHDRLEPRRACL